MSTFTNGYGFRKLLTIDHTKVGASLTDFPMLVSFTDAAVASVANGGQVTDDISEINSKWLKSDSALKAYYRMESGALTTDSSGNSNTLTNTGTVASVSGLFGNAADLGSSNTTKYLSLVGNLGITNGAFSMGGWVKLQAEIGSGTWSLLGQSSVGTYLINLIDYDYNGGNQQLHVQRFKGGVGIAGEIFYPIALGTSAWHLIIYVFDGSNIKLYVDNVLAGTVAVSGIGSSAVGDSFTIGVNKDHVGFSSALFDDCFVLNRGLTKAEVASVWRGGADIRFELADGTKLDHEIESYVNTSGKLISHVRIPSLSNSVDTSVYVYFGKSSITAVEENITGVWASNNKAVFHFADINDSTANALALVNTNSVAFSSGIIGNAADGGSSNTNKYLYVLTNAGIDGGTVSLSCLLKMNTEIASGIATLVCQQNTNSDVAYMICYDYNGGTRRLVFRRYRQGISADEIYYPITLGTSNIHHLKLTYDGTNLRGYVDGSLVVGPTAFSGNGSGTTSDHISVLANRGGAGTPSEFSSALVDEVRVVNTAEATSWISTESNSLLAPSTFMSVGASSSPSIQITKQLKYLIKTKQSVTKSLRYLVIGKQSVIKSLKFSVQTRATPIQKSLTYAFRFVYTDLYTKQNTSYTDLYPRNV